nr:hypothetical protein [Tanacetum cinerariifolium]
MIEDENAMDKGVADTVQDHKRKHDDDEDDNDDDDEDALAGPNQGKKIKRSRTKESKSSNKTSFTKETLKGKAPTKGSKSCKSASPVKEPIAEVIMNDAGDDVPSTDLKSLYQKPFAFGLANSWIPNMGIIHVATGKGLCCQPVGTGVNFGLPIGTGVAFGSPVGNGVPLGRPVGTGVALGLPGETGLTFGVPVGTGYGLTAGPTPIPTVIVVIYFS